MPKHQTAALQVLRRADVPLPETSGLCLRREADGSTTLLAIGDREATIAWCRLPHDVDGPLSWATADLTGADGTALPAHDPQLEAIASDGAGRVLLLQESPPRCELIDPPSVEVIARIALTVEGDTEVARSWRDPGGSHGEGCILLRDGHLLVAKEKDPSAIVEFGPAGAEAIGVSPATVLPPGQAWEVSTGDLTYVALATWLPDGALAKACGDLSDLQVGPDGHLYVLSDQSASIARLETLPPDGGVARASAEWTLDDVDGKPEGLAFLPSGFSVVALDTRKAKHNLLLMGPAIAAP
jgi:hypothetical protein